ncbi:hypothetical protein [Nocardia seriolae]|nr:hypothetical protein [Nocardia seriolae]OJF82009.1 hypothetical protein NS14008_26115 [Nocardia seriolae]WNJ61109.1 hypothetical protein RMO66_10645 [Nocardia seriolae]
MRRPRAMVLDEVWRRLDGVEPLSGPHGGPLRRTVKLILDPLVIRPVQHPQCAGSMLSADGAVLLATRIHAAADVLRATAAWFTLLKQTRRGLRITEGNAQDLYFQRCFELATVNGLPDPVRDRAAAESALREIHGLSAGRTTQALKEYLADPARVGELTDLIHTAWRRRPRTDVPDHSAALADLVDACAATRFDDAANLADLDAAIAASVGTHTGIRLWRNTIGGIPQEFGGAAHGIGSTAQELGLTLHPLPQPPRVGESASTATLGLPFDRTIHERIFTVLQASSERADLPPIPELVDAEIARACAPWALLDESLRVAAAAGAALAVTLCPLGRTPGNGYVPGRNATPERKATSERNGVPEHDGGPVAVVRDPSETAAQSLALAGTATGLLGAAVGLTGTAAGLLGTAAGLLGATVWPGTAVRVSPAVAGLTGAAIESAAAALGQEGVPDAPTRSPDPVAGGSAVSVVRPGAAGDRPTGTAGAEPDGVAARLVNSRWQREAYVLQARRMAVRVDAVEGPLGAIAAELRVPWRPYLRRLWARLHGRDVREFPVYAADELWDLLDGVARSVILDHRMRVKRALAVSAVAEPGDRESRVG